MGGITADMLTLALLPTNFCEEPDFETAGASIIEFPNVDIPRSASAH